jgi:hypothetical protein
MQQGWPKMVNNLMLQGDDNALLLALIAPFQVTLVAQGKVVVDTAYPFSDTVVVTITDPTVAYTFAIRIPGWATNATASINGKNVLPHQQPANGTLFNVRIGIQSTTTIMLDLGPEVRVETGWGNTGKLATSPVSYTPAGAVVPSTSQTDFVLSGGAGWSADPARKTTDIRSGGPGSHGLITFAHMLTGLGHNVSGFQLSFRYVCGYGPRGPLPGKQGPTVSVSFVDAKTGSVLGVGWTSKPLQNYSYDQGDPFSPPVTATVTGLDVDNWGPIAVRLDIANNDRNLQLDDGSISLKITWSAAVDPRPTPPPSPDLVPPTNAATVLRGPLVYSLLLTEQAQQVKTWAPFNNLDMNIVCSPTPLPPGMPSW